MGKPVRHRITHLAMSPLGLTQRLAVRVRRQVRPVPRPCAIRARERLLYSDQSRTVNVAQGSILLKNSIQKRGRRRSSCRLQSCASRRSHSEPSKRSQARFRSRSVPRTLNEVPKPHTCDLLESRRQIRVFQQNRSRTDIRLSSRMPTPAAPKWQDMPLGLFTTGQSVALSPGAGGSVQNSVAHHTALPAQATRRRLALLLPSVPPNKFFGSSSCGSRSICVRAPRCSASRVCRKRRAE